MRLLLLIVAITGSMAVSAQVGIGVNHANVDPSAQLEVSSTNKGFLVPRMTSSQRTGISNPASGLLVYQTDAPIGFYYFTQGNWKILGEQDITVKLNISDTTEMLSGYVRIQRLLDSVFSIQSRLNQKLNIGDTASMLMGYASVSRLMDSLSSFQMKLNLKFNSKDTSSLSARIDANKKGIIDTAAAIRADLGITNLAIQSLSEKTTKDILDSTTATRSALSDTATDIRSALVDSSSNIRSALSDTATDIRSALSDSSSNIRSALSDTATDIRSALSDTSTNIRSALSDSSTNIRSALADSSTNIRSALLDTASNLRSYSDLKVNISDTATMLDNRFARDTASLSSRIGEKLNITDTASMLDNRFARDTASLSSRINEKLNIADTASMLDNRFARDTASLSSRINTNKQAIIDTASNLRSYADLKVNIADTATMLSNRFARDTASLSTRINTNKQAIIDTASNLRSYADLKVNIADTSNMLNPYLRKVDTASLSTRINTNKQAIIDTAINLRSYADLKVNIADTATMLSNRFARDTVSLSSRIDLKVNIADTSSMLTSYLRKSDTSAMLSNRFERDTASLSSRINLKLSSVDTTNMLTSYLRKSDTSAMLSNRFARDTTSLSSRIDLKLNIADTASMLDNRFAKDTVSLSNRINTLSTNAVPYTGATKGVNLGAYDLTVNGITVGKGGGNKSSNTASGGSALSLNTTGSYNTAIGYRTLSANTSGENNTANGADALTSNTTGANNTAYGSSTLLSNSTGNGNTAIGYFTLAFNTGNKNTANGNRALQDNTTGSNNTASGTTALYSNTTGSNNTAIGYGADVLSNNLTNATAIGNGAIVAASNTIQLGNTAVTNVKTSGTLTAGAVTYPNSAGTNGYYLKTDGSGTASWAAVASFDSTSLSNRINLKLSSSDTASLSSRINLKLNISDTATMLSSYLKSVDTSSLSRRIDSLRPLSSGDIVYGGTNGDPTRLSIGDDGQVLTLTNGLPIWAANNGVTTVGPMSATATATGAYIASNTLYLAPADADNAGIVSTATQTFAGTKTFNSDLTVNGKITSSNTDRSTFAGKLTIGTNSDTTSSAVLEASSTTQGFLPPRLTTTQRDAITTPVAGLTIWNASNTQLEVYDGSYWKNMVGLLVSPLNVGDTYGGGKVFYIFGPSDNGYIKGQTHGLIAATVDQTTDAGVKWFPDKFYGVTGTYIGLGLPNTLAIITSAIVTGTTNMSSFAAGLANSYRGGGYIDWFLPSKDELNLLYQAKDAIGGFATTGHPTYWSSTQKGTINLKDFASFVKGVESARTQFFFTTTGPDGKVAGTQSDLGIDNPRRVRAIRIF